jgi:MoaA/NifB/PqqE/SkfB family radical SAM enzyme
MKRWHFVTLYPTRRCDLACAYCADSFHLPVMGPNAPIDKPWETFWKPILERWAPETEYFSILGGEPTLYAELPQMVEFLAQSGCKFGITTDGRAEIAHYVDLCQKGLPEIALSIDSFQRENCANKSAWIKAERNLKLMQVLSLARKSRFNPPLEKLTLLWCTVVTKHNVGEVVRMAQEAAGLGAIFAPCPVQEGYHESLAVAAQGPQGAAHPDDLAMVAEILLKNYDSLKLAEPRAYYELWTNRFDMDRVWHCSEKLRAPSIDSDGSLWSCYAYQGVNSPKLNWDSPWEEIHAASQADMNACAGCSWNCLWTSDQIAQGIVPQDFWV